MSAGPWKQRLAVLTLAHVVGTLHMVSIMAMAPLIQRALGLSVAQVGLLVTGYYFAQMVGALPAGSVVDRIGVGRALVVAMSVEAIGALVLWSARGFATALAAAVVIGSGYCLVNPATAKGVLLWCPVDRRATAMGIKQTGVSIGGVAAAANGVLAAFVDWRAIVLANFLVTACFAVPCLRLAGADEGGLVVRRPGIGGLRAVWAERNLRVLFVSGMTWNMGQTNFFAYLTLFMRHVAGASQPVAGLCLGVAQAVSALGRIGWGVVSDTLFRGGRKWLTVTLCAAAAVFLALMAAVGRAHGVAAGVALSLALGLTIASFASLVQTLAVEAVEPAHAGSAMGFSMIGTAAGGMLGPALFGAIVDATGDFDHGWLASAAIVAAGTVLLAAWFRERSSRDS